MYYPDELIEDIRISNDLYNVVSEYIQLKKQGNSFVGLCPFHNEKTPSFNVSQDKQLYHCFGCGAGGNVYTFVMQIENYSFLEAVEHLAERSHITLPTPEISEEVQKKIMYNQKMLEINRESAKYFYHQLYSNRGKLALQYLNERNLQENIYKKFGIGYSNITRNDLYQYLLNKGYKQTEIMDTGLIKVVGEKNQISDRFWNRIIFPILDVHNKVIGFGGRVLGEGLPKYLNSPESKIFNKRKHLYGLNLARTSKREYIIVVEGYMDVISLTQAGMDNVVASLGTALTTEQALLLKRYTSDVVLAYDSDEAGIKAAQRAIPILEKTGLGVKVVQIPDYKDPDEYIKNRGMQSFETLINNAKTGVMFEADVLRNQYSLEKPEEKIKLTMNLAKRLVDIENKIEQDVYVQQLSKEIKVSENALKDEMTKIIQNTGIISTNKYKKDKSKFVSNDDGLQRSQKTLLAIIINSKNIYHIIKEYVKPIDFLDPLYSKTAEYVYSQYEQGEKVNLANLVNKFIEVEEQNKVSSIQNIKIQFESERQKEKAINDIVKMLKQANIDNASRTNLSIEKLQELILEKRKLQNLHIKLT